jgi:uncharacterized coiled-coil protein SlyX
MPKKITVTDEDGTVTELTEERYTAMLREAASAILSTPEFENTLQGMMNKVGDELIKRITNVEQKVEVQGEKIQRLETKVATQDAQIKDNGDRVEVLAQEVESLKKNFVGMNSKTPSEPRVTFEPYAVTTSPMPDFPTGRGQLYSKPLPLDTCPVPSNLKEEFRNLLYAKHKNRKQIVIGPVLSKEVGDGFLDKDNLNPLDDDEVDKAIRAVGVSGTFHVTVTNPEKRMARVRFEGPNAEAACETIIASWRLLRDEFSMWAGPDQPVDLSKMVVNAKKFGITLRADANLPATSYVDVKDGILFIGAIRLPRFI